MKKLKEKPRLWRGAVDSCREGRTTQAARLIKKREGNQELSRQNPEYRIPQKAGGPRKGTKWDEQWLGSKTKKLLRTGGHGKNPEGVKITQSKSNNCKDPPCPQKKDIHNGSSGELLKKTLGKKVKASRGFFGKVTGYNKTWKGR